MLWTTGATLPLAELRAETGVPVLVDGAQSVGAIPATVAGLDFLTISGQKWLCGPDSTGALVVADPERLRLVSPSYFSQRRYEPDGAYEPQPGGAALRARLVVAGVAAGLLAALELRPDVVARARRRGRGALPRAARAAGRAGRPRDALDARRVPRRGRPGAVVARLHEADVHVREIPGRGLVRVSCGWWTSDEDLERLVAALQ